MVANNYLRASDLFSGRMAAGIGVAHRWHRVNRVVVVFRRAERPAMCYSGLKLRATKKQHLRIRILSGMLFYNGRPPINLGDFP